MANGHGGSRTPANPAPVSGPGAMSRRTDGGPAQPARYMAGGDYGDGQAMMDLQTSAPMSASPTPQTRAQSAGAGQGVAAPVPLGAPTQRPDEPVTEGNPMGAGAGPSVLSSYGSPSALDADQAVLAQYLPRLLIMAGKESAPAGFRMFVRHLRNTVHGV